MYCVFPAHTSQRELLILIYIILPDSGRSARVSAYAGLINQLQRCRFDSRIACYENSYTVIVGDWWTGVGDTSPCTVN